MNNNAIKCAGCGAPLQSESQNKVGFIDATKLHAENTNALICRRCFRLRHYSALEPIESHQDYLMMMQSIAKEDALIVYVLDLFDFEGSLLPGVKRHTAQEDFIVVGNKRDTLPKPWNNNRIEQFVNRRLKEEGIKPLSVRLTSTKNKLGIDALITDIFRFRKKRNVYIIGATNVGKSSLVNCLLDQLTDDVTRITVSPTAGTTLDFIHIPFDDSKAMIDTPGVILSHSIGYHLLPASQQACLIKQEVKQRVYQLNAGQTVFIAGLAMFSYISGEHQPFVFYANQDLPLHRTKWENKAHIFSSMVGKSLTPPSSEETKTLTYVKTQFNVKATTHSQDVVISGLGFVTFSGSGVVEVETLKGVRVYLRESMK